MFIQNSNEILAAVMQCRERRAHKNFAMNFKYKFPQISVR